jgi:hypothetical protein
MDVSSRYRWADMLAAVRLMADDGVGGLRLYTGSGSDSEGRYALVNIAVFLAQSYVETIMYDACDENNWSKGYAASAACGQLGQSYQDFTCVDMTYPDGSVVRAAELQCTVLPDMVVVASTSAAWYGAPPPLFCAPRSQMPRAPRWDVSGNCPASDTYYGRGSGVEHVPPEVLAAHPTYVDYVAASIDQGTGASCMSKGTCCMDAPNQRAGSWKSCPGGCSNADGGRVDVEGCCWWGRGVIQTTGPCNNGKLNYFLGKRAAERGIHASYAHIDFCKDPGIICKDDHPELKWITGLLYWIETVQPYDRRGGSYMRTLRNWVDTGMHADDTSLIDFASAVVNRGRHDAPLRGDGPHIVHMVGERRAWFLHVIEVLHDQLARGHPHSSEAARGDPGSSGTVKGNFHSTTPTALWHGALLTLLVSVCCMMRCCRPKSTLRESFVEIIAPADANGDTTARVRSTDEQQSTDEQPQQQQTSAVKSLESVPGALGSSSVSDGNFA